MYTKCVHICRYTELAQLHLYIPNIYLNVHILGTENVHNIFVGTQIVQMHLYLYKMYTLYICGYRNLHVHILDIHVQI